MSDEGETSGLDTDHDGWYTKRFWEALREGRFLVGDCPDCERAHFPPAPVCPHCGARADTTEAERTGELHSFTRQHRTAPGFESPITIGTVELAEGPRVLMEVRGEYESLRIGMDVRIAVDEYGREYDRGALSDYPMFAAQPE